MTLPSHTSAVLWDMDGTLIDQTEGIIRCYTEVISALGYPTPNRKEIHRSMGGPMAQTMALFVQPEELDQACLQFRTRFPEIMFEGMVILPGALQLIRHFHKRGVPQGILTNKHGPTARKVSEYCMFSEYIAVCMGNTDTEWNKPDPALTRHLLKALHVTDDKNAIIIGDSPTDVKSAENAGLACYAVTTGAHSQDELIAAGAADAVTSLEDWLPA
ncbi:MAG: HAD family hydrolase [Coraliomargaritaceae bacterium]